MKIVSVKAPAALLGSVAGLLLVIALLIAPQASAAKGVSHACSQWGDAPPAQITRGQARKATLCLLNQERAKAGLSAVKRNKKLQGAAQKHNDVMVGTGCFDHECPGESDLGQRLDQIGYLVGGLTQWAFGENIAWGFASQGTPREIMGAWMNSDGHRANILNPNFKEVGVGFNIGTPDDGSDPGGVYTTDFGLRVH